MLPFSSRCGEGIEQTEAPSVSLQINVPDFSSNLQEKVQLMSDSDEEIETPREIRCRLRN